MASYQLNTKVLVYQGPLLYEAKITKLYYPVSQIVKYRDEKLNEIKEVKPDARFPQDFLTSKAYCVHYKGWNTKWDEWVLTNRMLEINTESLLLQKNLKLKLKEEQARAKAALDITLPDSKLSQSINGNGLPSSSSNGNRQDTSLKSSRPAKRTKNDSTSSKDKSSKKHDFKITFPDQLKLLLVNDWENISKLQKLLTLPSPVSINKLLSDYSDVIMNTNSSEKVEVSETLSNYLEIIQSLRLYFAKALGTFVLYRQEREQFKEIIDKFGNLELTEVYSPIHFLRLITVLPNLMFQSGLDHQSIKLIQRFLNGFLVWLNDNRQIYLMDSYENSLPLVM